MVKDCLLELVLPSVVVKVSKAGDNAITGPAFGGNGRTVISTLIVTGALTLDEMVIVPESSPGVRPTR